MFLKYLLRKDRLFGVLLAVTVLFSAISCISGNEQYYIQSAEIPEGYSKEQKVEISARVLPHPRQMKWFEDEFFGFIHFGPNTFTGMEWGTGLEEPDLFNPTKLETDQWCRLMSEAEMKRVVVVAKHHEGFVMWPSRYTDHSVASSPWKNGEGDVIGELVESCREYDIRIGIYLSPADLYQIESEGGYYGNNSKFTDRVIPRPIEGKPFEDKRTFTYRVDDYNEYFLNQLFELLTEYGPIHEVWFDGANPKPGTGQTYNYQAWYDMIRKLAPHASIFGKGPDARWCGNEGGGTRKAEYNIIPLDSSPDSLVWPDNLQENIAGRNRITKNTQFFHYYPAETNTSIRDGWFWRNDNEQKVRTTENVFDIYERSVGGNSVFHLNIPPNSDGKFSPRDTKVLRETGQLIRKVYGNNLFSDAESSAQEVLDGDTDTWWEADGKEGQLNITLPEPRKINRFMVREAIAHRGERIEDHTLEALVNNNWVEVATGKTVGNKRILRFPAIKTDQFRLSITKARLNPTISHISGHFYDEPPKPVIIERNAEGEVTLGVGTSFSWKRQTTVDQSQPIYYTIDGSEPTAESIRYNKPFKFTQGGLIRARAIMDNREGPMTEENFGIIGSDWTVSLSGPGSELNQSITLDNIWICCKDESFEYYTISIDMGETRAISGIMYKPTQKLNGYIENYSIEISLNGEDWEVVEKGSFGNIKNDPSVRAIRFDQNLETRFVRLNNLTPPGLADFIGASRIEILP